MIPGFVPGGDSFQGMARTARLESRTFDSTAVEIRFKNPILACGKRWDVFL